MVMCSREPRRVMPARLSPERAVYVLPVYDGVKRAMNKTQDRISISKPAFRLTYLEGYDAVVPVTEGTFCKAPAKAPTIPCPICTIVETTSLDSHIYTLGSARPTIVSEVSKSTAFKADFRLGEILSSVESNSWNI